MSNVLILGARGGIGKLVAARLAGTAHVARLFVRDSSKAEARRNQEIFVGDAAHEEDLFKAMDGIDIVYSNLGPYQMKGFADRVVSAMKRRSIRRVLWTATAGIYGEFDPEVVEQNYAELDGPPTLEGSYLHDQWTGADVIENSGLDYTILRWNWLTSEDHETDVVISRKGEILKGGAISRLTAAGIVTSIIDQSERFAGESIGVAAV
ncbi:NAD(P)H-binding protein [Brucella intermedia]|uniref:NAD(P)H-binding protein n=1 Tax=Brucella intermedia TaxID=94625 RepID=UPI00224AC6A4|nr:NAD(P)H-binding protein [Brucella intermedia]